MATMYTAGRVTHERDETTGRALCGRDVAGWLNLSGMSGWERIGFEAASNGPCANCSRKLQAARTTTAPAIKIDNTPAGIYAAMMRANASEQTAPQDRLYGLLSDHLQRTLTAEYGQAGSAIYASIISSGEASDDVIMSALGDYNYLRAQEIADRTFIRAHIVIGADGIARPVLTPAAPTTGRRSGGYGPRMH